MPFGCGPATDGSITYQPDVVIVGGGASAIRSWEPDGITWTINGHAPGADRIAAGKVVFVTDLAVGRVLALSRAGEDLRVTFGPVVMGEIIRDGEVRWDEPISFEDAAPRLAPSMPGLAVDQTPPSAGTAGTAMLETSTAVHPTVELAAARGWTGIASLAADDGPPITVNINPDFDFGQLCCAPRMGAMFNFDQGGIRIQGGIWLRLEHPFSTGYAIFKKGELIDGLIVIGGVKGIHLEFEAATAPGGSPTNVDQRYLLPVQYSARPKAKTGVPLLNSAWQGYQLKTAFSAGSSTMLGSADYDFNSSVLRAQMSDKAGLIDISVPTDFTTKTPLLDTLTGVSVGVNALILGMTAVFCLCYGAMVYSNGLYIHLSAVFGTTNDSSAVGILGGRCRDAAFRMDALVGSGHHLDQGFTDELNKNEGLTGDAQVSADLGFSQEVPMWQRTATIPVGIDRCLTE